MWEQAYNLGESSLSLPHGPDWTHFNEKMAVHWNRLIPDVLLFPVHHVHLQGFPPSLQLGTEMQPGLTWHQMSHAGLPHWVQPLKTPGVQHAWVVLQLQWCMGMSPACSRQSQMFRSLPAFLLHPVACCLGRYFWFYKHALVSIFSSFIFESLGLIYLFTWIKHPL